MRDRLESPRLSLRERERRWAAVRRAMRERGLECLVLFGSPSNWDFTVANARYLAPIGGNAAFNVLVFPLEGEPTSFVFRPTFVEYWKRAQDWVVDVRARKGPWAQSVASRLKELGLEKAAIGLDGLAGPLDPDGWLPHSVYAGLRELRPSAQLVNTDDMLERLRSIKNTEEIQVLEQAARLGDLMLAACRERARPGVRECEVYGKMMEVMLANGGEEPTLFLWAADASPFPHPFRLPTMRPLARGDLIICEIHPKYGGYFTHVERTFSLGGARSRVPEDLRGLSGGLRDGAGILPAGPEDHRGDERCEGCHHRPGPRHVRDRDPRPRPGLAGVSALPPPRPRGGREGAAFHR